MRKKGIFLFLENIFLLTIGSDAMLETVELPARVANLDSSLPDMDGETFPHFWDGGWCKVLVLVLVRDGGWCKVRRKPETKQSRPDAQDGGSRARSEPVLRNRGLWEISTLGLLKCVNQLFVL